MGCRQKSLFLRGVQRCRHRDRPGGTRSAVGHAGRLRQDRSGQSGRRRGGPVLAGLQNPQLLHQSTGRDADRGDLSHRGVVGAPRTWARRRSPSGRGQRRVVQAERAADPLDALGDGLDVAVGQLGRQLARLVRGLPRGLQRLEQPVVEPWPPRCRVGAVSGRHQVNEQHRRAGHLPGAVEQDDGGPPVHQLAGGARSLGELGQLRRAGQPVSPAGD